MVEQTKDSTLSLVERAEAAAKAIQQANEEQKLLLERAEKAKARDMLGGTTQAGQAPPPVAPETPKQYKDRIMKGQL